MILANKKDPVDLRKRREYLQELIAEPRPNVSPSSEEWVSSECHAGFKSLLRAEVREIDEVLKTLEAKR